MEQIHASASGQVHFAFLLFFYVFQKKQTSTTFRLLCFAWFSDAHTSMIAVHIYIYIIHIIQIWLHIYIYIYTTYNTYMIAVAMLAQVVSQAQLGPQPNFFVQWWRRRRRERRKRRRRRRKIWRISRAASSNTVLARNLRPRHRPAFLRTSENVRSKQVQLGIQIWAGFCRVGLCSVEGWSQIPDHYKQSLWIGFFSKDMEWPSRWRARP